MTTPATSLLFCALDDEIKAQYYLYENYDDEYPSEFSIKALQEAEKEGIGTSNALKKMNRNLAKDIMKSA